MRVKHLETKRLQARVTGRVQGVGFRYYVLGEAVRLGLTGWVRNRRDGSVEVLAEGEQEQLERLVQTLKRGSSSSLVADVKIDWLESTGEFPGFSARVTI
jgi:acylphosphatase